MDEEQLSWIFNDPEISDRAKAAYMKRIAVAYEPENIHPEVKDLFHQLAPDHEIQLLTDGTPEHCWAIGIGDNDKVNMPAEARAELYERYVQMRMATDRPIYLIHNHPAVDKSVADTIPSPSDFNFFSKLPAGLIPAIYTNRTNTVIAFPFDT